MTKKHSGKDIREVWDWRLSSGSPILFNSGDTWIVKIFANDGSGLLKEHDTGIPTTDEDGRRNNHDQKAIAACYDWLRSVRDEYSRDNIDLRKPVVALINHANDEINKLASSGSADVKKAVVEFNNLIRMATKEMHEKIPAGGVQ